jgi:hypothetical protein
LRRIPTHKGETHADALEEVLLVRQLRHSGGVGTMDAKSGLRLARNAQRGGTHLGCFTVRHLAALRNGYRLAKRAMLALIQSQTQK